MCQVWLNETAGTLMPPSALNFNEHYGSYGVYRHNLNCTWIINAKAGFYINLEISIMRVGYLYYTHFKKKRFALNFLTPQNVSKNGPSHNFAIPLKSHWYSISNLHAL